MNQHIDDKVRRLSHKYGGLSMFDLNMMGLRDRLHYLIVEVTDKQSM